MPVKLPKIYTKIYNIFATKLSKIIMIYAQIPVYSTFVAPGLI